MNHSDWEDTHFDAAPWGGYEDESDYEYAMQYDTFDAPEYDDYSMADDNILWDEMNNADTFIGGE